MASVGIVVVAVAGKFAVGAAVAAVVAVVAAAAAADVGSAAVSGLHLPH